MRKDLETYKKIQMIKEDTDKLRGLPDTIKRIENLEEKLFKLAGAVGSITSRIGTIAYQTKTILEKVNVTK
jgi:hypothetical protein